MGTHAIETVPCMTVPASLLTGLACQPRTLSANSSSLRWNSVTWSFIACRLLFLTSSPTLRNCSCDQHGSVQHLSATLHHPHCGIALAHGTMQGRMLINTGWGSYAHNFALP